MALPAPTFEGIKKALRAGQYAPVYLLHGLEGYYVDALAKEFENILTDDEKVFNQYVLFGADTDAAKIIDLCHRIPMMADRQVVIIKEAQAMRADQLDKLAPYVENPVETTILVICCRGAEAKGRQLKPALKKGNAVVFEAKKVTEYNAPALIGEYIRTKGLSAEPKALEMLRDFIGTDLSRLYNEIDKLAAILPSGAAVTPEVIERNIGISRDYNSFELVDAIAARDAQKTFRIAAYFKANPKAVPLVMVTASLFGLFADVLTAYYAPDKTDHGLAEALGLKNTWGLKRIRLAMSRYNAFQVIEIISAIRQFDVRSKGVGSRQNEHQLFHDLIYHIVTAPGRL